MQCCVDYRCSAITGKRRYDFLDQNDDTIDHFDCLKFIKLKKIHIKFLTFFLILQIINGTLPSPNKGLLSILNVTYCIFLNKETWVNGLVWFGLVWRYPGPVLSANIKY